MTKDKSNNISWMTAEEFLKTAQSSTEIEELFEKLDSGDAAKILDDAQLRRQEDWSALANQVVGAENVGS